MQKCAKRILLSRDREGYDVHMNYQSTTIYKITERIQYV